MTAPLTEDVKALEDEPAGSRKCIIAYLAFVQRPGSHALGEKPSFLRSNTRDSSSGNTCCLGQEWHHRIFSSLLAVTLALTFDLVEV